jgi:hypothetical protein
MIVIEQLIAKVDHRRANQTTNRKVGFLVAMIVRGVFFCARLVKTVTGLTPALFINFLTSKSSQGIF